MNASEPNPDMGKGSPRICCPLRTSLRIRASRLTSWITISERLMLSLNFYFAQRYDPRNYMKRHQPHFVLFVWVSWIVFHLEFL